MILLVYKPIKCFIPDHGDDDRNADVFTGLGNRNPPKYCDDAGCTDKIVRNYCSLIPQK